MDSVVLFLGIWNESEARAVADGKELMQALFVPASGRLGTRHGNTGHAGVRNTSQENRWYFRQLNPRLQFHGNRIVELLELWLCNLWALWCYLWLPKNRSCASVQLIKTHASNKGEDTRTVNTWYSVGHFLVTLECWLVILTRVFIL